MGQIFNSPPGWPKPPDGWTPPPGWTPDPSWPAAPEGWQFWVDDPFTAAVAAERTTPAGPNAPAQPPPSTQPGGPPSDPPTDPQTTQVLGVPPTQAMPQAAPQPTLYSYAPSSGLEQPGASPYGNQPLQGGGAYPGGAYVSPGGPVPKQRNTGMIIVVAVVAVLVLSGLVWGLTSLFSGGGDEDPTAVEPTTVEPSDDPTGTTDVETSDEPSDDPTTEEPTDEPSDDPTTDPGGGTTSGNFTDLTAGEPALVYGASGEPVVEVRLLEARPGWSPSQGSALCGDPEQGQYLGVNLEFTILPAKAEESTPTYTFIGWELGAMVDDLEVETSAFATGMFCVSSDERAPAEMQPGETYTGWSVMDVPEGVTAVTFEDLFDWSSGASAFRWVLADQ